MTTTEQLLDIAARMVKKMTTKGHIDINARELSESISSDERFESAKVSEMRGVTFDEIKISQDKTAIKFVANDGRTFVMVHVQECCEGVSLEDIVGDLDDLIGAPIAVAYEASNDSGDCPLQDKIVKKEYGYADDYYQWTFYHFATINGWVTFRWFGMSNGYYSVDVDLFASKE